MWDTFCLDRRWFFVTQIVKGFKDRSLQAQICKSGFEFSHADLAAEQAEVYGITALEQAEPPSARTAVGAIKISAEPDVKNTLDGIWCAVKQIAADELRSAGSGALSVLMIVIICSMLASVFDGGRLPEYITLAGCLSIAYTAVNSVCSLVSMDEVPNAAAINEAVELAKSYDEPETVSFVNGILGSFIRGELEKAGEDGQ